MLTPASDLRPHALTSELLLRHNEKAEANADLSELLRRFKSTQRARAEPCCETNVQVLVLILSQRPKVLKGSEASIVKRPRLA